MTDHQDLALKCVDLECAIEPGEKTLEAKGVLTFSEAAQSVSLMLNHRLAWTRIQVQSVGGWEEIEAIEKPVPQDSFLKFVKLWELGIPSRAAKAPLRVRVAYKGMIAETSFDTGQIDAEFVELAVYAAWYPVLPWMPMHSFKLKLESPPGWSWIANGLRTSTDETSWEWESAAPDADITLVGMPTRLLAQETDALFWGPGDWVESRRDIAEAYLQAESLLVDWLGPMPQRLRVAYAHRDTGGAFSRNGLIVTQGIVKGGQQGPRNYPAIIQSLLHEVMHFWFKKTPIDTYDNWLDEALAEYASLIVAGELYGDEWFSQHIEAKRQQLDQAGDLMPIRSVVRSHPDAYALFYNRGMLLFHEIRQKMGLSWFKDWVAGFAQRCLSSDKITTKDLFHKDLQSLVDRWLDYEGQGVPGE